MNDTARGVVFCLICFVVLVLWLSYIWYVNICEPWPEMDYPKTEVLDDG